MNEKREFSDIGEKIRDALQEAAKTGDFRQINRIVGDTVNSAMEEVRCQISSAHGRARRPVERPESAVEPEPFVKPETKKQPPAVYMDKKGRVSGVLFMVFGGIGLGICSLFLFFLLVCWLFTWDRGILPAMIFFGIADAAAVGMLRTGMGLRARLRRAQRYLKLAAGKMYIELEELAASTGQSVKRVRKDVRKMLNHGIFPEGHLDQKETVFVLNDELWNQYLMTQKSWEEQRLAEEQDKTADPRKENGAGELSEEEQIEREGREYMDRLRQLNIEIPGEVISNKLYQLDYLLQRIFMVLREHPEKCGQMRKFMEYYLPTTVKLVESYADFDKAGVRGDHIMAARTEIEKTMDTINAAFEKLLDDMYQDAAMEAAADAKVLKTILAQDGYTESEFSSGKKKEGENK